MRPTSKRRAKPPAGSFNRTAVELKFLKAKKGELLELAVRLQNRLIRNRAELNRLKKKLARSEADKHTQVAQLTSELKSLRKELRDLKRPTSSDWAERVGDGTHGQPQARLDGAGRPITFDDEQKRIAVSKAYIHKVI